MSAALEQQYRQVLRWYPKRWRERNADAAIGTLLELAHEDGRSAPANGELRNLRLSGLGARAGIFERAIPAAVRDRVSAIALGTGLAISAWGILFSIVSAALLHGGIPGVDFQYWGRPSDIVTFGPFASLDIILYALWVAAFGAALLGKPWLMRAFLIAALPAAVAARVLSEQLGMTVYPISTQVILLAVFALFGMLGTPRPRARWRLWIGISGAVAIGTLALTMWISQVGLSNLGDSSFYDLSFFYRGALTGWVCVCAPILVILCITLGRWVWAGVATISFLPWLALCLAASAHRANSDIGDQLAWVGIGLAATAIATVVSLRAGRVRIHITFSRPR